MSGYIRPKEKMYEEDGEEQRRVGAEESNLQG